MLNRYGKSGHPYGFLLLGGKLAFSLSLLSMVLAGVFHGFVISLSKSSFIPSLLNVFIMEESWIYFFEVYIKQPVFNIDK